MKMKGPTEPVHFYFLFMVLFSHFVLLYVREIFALEQTETLIFA